MNKVNFFTCAGGRTYHKFIIPYIASTLISNEDATVEIVTDAPKSRGFKQICDIFPEATIWAETSQLRKSGFPVTVPFNKKPDSFRFLIIPQKSIEPKSGEILSELTYIGDIDIIVLEDVYKPHKENMQKLGLPYSNIIRTGHQSDRLSGLHVVDTDRYYNYTREGHQVMRSILQVYFDFDVWSKYSDEQLLYMLCKEGPGLPKSTGGFRPQHGIHVSPARQPMPQGNIPGWGITPQRLRVFDKMRKDERWIAAEKLFDPAYRDLVKQIDEVYVKDLET